MELKGILFKVVRYDAKKPDSLKQSVEYGAGRYREEQGQDANLVLIAETAQPYPSDIFMMHSPMVHLGEVYIGRTEQLDKQ